VVEGGDGAGLLLEAAQAIGIVAQLGREDLDGDVAAEAGVAGAVHLAHPPGPDQVEDLVRPQPHAGGKGHGKLRLDSASNDAPPSGRFNEPFGSARGRRVPYHRGR